MRKYSFLVPVAAAVAALTGSNQLAAGTQAAVDQLPADSATNAQSGLSNSFTVQTTSDRLDSFVLARSEEGLLFAQHESHASHSSHASHASHSSHTSGVSLA